MILTLPEQFKLLSLNNKDRKYISIYSVSLCLFQLITTHKLELISNKENLILKNSSSTHKDYLDIILTHISHESPRSFSEWIQYFYINPYITAKINLSILDNLVNKQVLRKKESNVFFIFKKNKYIDYLDTQHIIIKNLKSDLLSETQPRENSIILSLILEKNNLLDKFISKDKDFNSIKSKISSFQNTYEYNLLKLCEDCILQVDSIKSSSVLSKNLK